MFSNVDKGFIIGGWRHPCCGDAYMAASSIRNYHNCVQGF